MADFEVIPAIDLQAGRCVRLLRGDFGQASVYSDDPLAVAQAFADAGAWRVHVVDLDASRDASLTNREQVETIIAWGGLAVQVAGGVRSTEAAVQWFGSGAHFVVLGTVVVEDFTAAAEIARRWPARVLFALDSKGGRLATHGWLEAPGPRAEDLLAAIGALPLAGVIFTNVERDGTMEGPDVEGVRLLSARLPQPVYASGGVASIDHLHDLARAGAAGAIIGRALYERRLDLRTAVSALR